MTSDTLAYLTALYASKPEDATILIWSKRDKAKLSRWGKSVDDAIRAIVAAEQEPGWDIYAGVCTGRVVGTPTTRILAKDVYSIPGVWADVDIAGAGHKSTKLPPTLSEATKIIKRVGIPTTMLVHSGGGLHGYWLFKEPCIPETPAEHKNAAMLSTAWQHLLMQHAQALSYVVDGTHDLARVLRVPGTMNYKNPVDPVLCKILEQDGPTYEPSELAGIAPPVPVELPTSDETFTLNASAEPPAEKFQLLAQIEARFLDSWECRRKDLADDTPSGYGASLATYAAYVEWTDQEIADLLVAHRRKHGFDLQLRHLKYYRNTIDLGRRAAARLRTSAEALQEAVDRSRRLAPLPGDPPASEAAEAPTADPPPMPRGPIPYDSTARAIGFLCSALHVQIKGIKKYLGDNPQFEIKTDKGKITLSGVDKVISQLSMRHAIADVYGILIPTFKRDDWDAVAQAMLDAAEPVESGTESTDCGAVKEWLRIYFDENPPNDLSPQAVINQMPFFHKGDMCFFLGHFRNWLLIRQSERMETKKLGSVLRQIGAKPDAVGHTTEDGKATTRAVWKVNLYADD